MTNWYTPPVNSWNNCSTYLPCSINSHLTGMILFMYLCNLLTVNFREYWPRKRVSPKCLTGFDTLRSFLNKRGWYLDARRIQCQSGKDNRLQVPWRHQFSSVAQSCPTLCNPMDCSTPGFLVHHQFLESTQTHVHRVGDAIQSSHPLLSPSPPAFNLSQHQGLFLVLIR